MSLNDFWKFLNTDLLKNKYGKIILAIFFLIILIAKFDLFLYFTAEGRCELSRRSFISKYNKTVQVLLDNEGIKESYIKVCLEGGGRNANEILNTIIENRTK